MTAKKETQIEIFIHQEIVYSLNELCEICQIQADRVNEIIDYGIIASRDQNNPNQWRFSLGEMETLQKVLRLERDLDLNMPGIAMTLDLLEQVESLRKQVDVLEHQLLHFVQSPKRND